MPDTPIRDRSLDDAFDRVYAALKPIARKQRIRVNGALTLQTTEILHEVYLKLKQSDSPPAWDDRLHFVRLAARVMRQVVVDYARERAAQKRGGDVDKVSMDENPLLKRSITITDKNAITMLTLDDALEKLGRRHPRQRDVVECRFFGGLTVQETADALDVSAPTVKRDWRTARTWLFKAISDA